MSTQGTGTSNSRSKVIAALAAVVVVAAIVAAILISRGADESSDDGGRPPGVTAGGGFRVGASAVEGVEQVGVAFYDDFLCEDCSQADSDFGGYLLQQADLGAIALEYRPVALPGNTSVEQAYSVRAGAAAACVAASEGVDGYLLYRSALYVNIQTLTDNGYEDGVLADLADNEDLGSARDCIESESYEGWVEDNTQAAVEAGVDAVPAVLVADEPVFGDEQGRLGLQNVLTAVSDARLAGQ